MTANTATTPTTQVVATCAGLLRFDRIMVDASLTGVAGGTLDVYLQREVDTNVWADWAHFPQITAGNAAVEFSLQSGSDKTIHTVEQGTAASAGTPALAAGTLVGGHPGNRLRMVFVTGAGATGPAKSQTVRVSGIVTDH